MFVITPFGDAEGSDEEIALFREIDGLRQGVLKRAAEICGEAGREVRFRDATQYDDLPPHDPDGADTIHSKTAWLIDEADAVVAVLTNTKPNAYIEYGWATAGWHSPILIGRRSTEEAPFNLPSDISNHLVATYYTKDIASGTDRDGIEKAAQDLSAAVLNRLARTRKRPPFAHLKPRKLLANGAIEVRERFNTIEWPEWSRHILAAEREIVMATPKGVDFRNRADFTDESGERMTLPILLQNRAFAGIDVTVITLHPENYDASQAKESGRSDRAVSIAKMGIEDAFEVWNTARRNFETATQRTGQPQGGRFRYIQVRNASIPWRLFWTDRIAFLTLRMLTESVNTGTALIVPAEESSPNAFMPPLHDQLRRELNFLIETNAKESEAEYQRWRDAQSA